MSDTEDFDFFVIDENKLDKEWFQQAQLMFDHCKLLAIAREKRDRARAAEKVAADDLKETYARLSLLIRKDPGLYGLEKVTESVIDAAVLVDSGYKIAKKNVYRATEELIARDRDVGILEAVVTALAHKKVGLEKSVELWCKAYFGKPSDRSLGIKGVTEAKVDAALGKRKENRDG